jgi:hypothetical protein
MNSYINLILESEGAKERLQRSLQSASEQSAANFFDSRHRPEANRAQKHSGSSQAKRWTPQTRTTEVALICLLAAFFPGAYRIGR